MTDIAACMACGDLRPDEHIDVHTRYRRHGPRARTASTLNVRYCNDQPACLAAAHVIGDIYVRTGTIVDRNDPRVKRAVKRAGGTRLPAPPKDRRRRKGTRLARWVQRVIGLG